MKLYSYWRSSSAWRVRIALAYKGVDYEYAPIHLLREGGEQHAGAYKTLNSMEQVPLLEYEDVAGTTRRISQSMAILEFLEEQYPAPALLPSDPFLRARARQIGEMVNSGIQPLQNLFVLQHVVERYNAEKTAWSQFWIARGLRALEASILETAGVFSVGDELSIADLFLVPQLYNARRFAVDLAAYPRLLRIEQACSELPAFESAHPDRQPDATKV